MENKNIITNELPIKSKDDDLLNYYPFAEKIKEIIQGYSSNPAPLTIGIYGKWGTGKTSLLNLVERHIELFQKDKEDKLFIKFHYNPWLYQSKEEMLFDFFNTLSRKLVYSENEYLKKAGEQILKYSRYLESVRLSVSGGIPKLFNAGITIEPYKILKALGEDLKGEEKSLEEMKKDIDKTLEISNKKIIIFIDDIDRLDKDEIFMLFKLIKTNADFKNLVFIICLDHEHVAKAIYSRYGPGIESGKEFLEKIINIPLEIPLIEKADLDLFIKGKVELVARSRLIRKEELDELLRSLNVKYFDSPREVIRIVNSFSVSLYAIGNEVNAHDLFWVEYLKLKYPDSYEVVKNYAKNHISNHILSSVITFNNEFDDSKNESGIRQILKDKNSKAYDIIDTLFPMDRTGTISGYQSKKIKPENKINKELRINHILHFEKYFSYHTKGKISELKFSNLKLLIQDGKKNEALNILEELLSNSAEYSVVYRLGSELDHMKRQDYEKYITFLVDNINLFKEGQGRSNSIQLIQSIGEKLRKDNPVENKSLSISIAKELDYFQLSYLLGRLQESSEIAYLKDLELVLIEKVKDLNLSPFYMKREVSNMIMEIWSKVNHEEFQQYILDSLKSKEYLFSFIKSFPYLWNDSIQGIFKKEDYVFLKEQLKLDMDLIYIKTKALVSDKFNLESLEAKAKNWNDKVNNSEIQNVDQFVYWHLKDKEN
nr:P-loop NTPase fold protein [uncultured Allomuricauda sp.]